MSDISLHKIAPDLEPELVIKQHAPAWYSLAYQTAIQEIKDLREKLAIYQSNSFRQSQLSFTQLLNFLPGVIYQYTTDLNTEKSIFSYISPKSQEIFELDPALCLESVDYVWALIHPDDLPRVQASAGHAIATNTRWLDEFRITTASGREKWIRGQSDAPTEIAPGISVHNGIFIDISDRKLAELDLQHSKTELEVHVQERTSELEQVVQDLKRTQAQLIHTEKMSSLGQLVAGIAHEINNPVSFIHGNLNPAKAYITDLLNLIELYQLEYPNPSAAIQEEQESVDLAFLIEDLPKLLISMETGTQRIRDIVRSLRNFSRLDESDLKTVDLHEGLESSLLILQYRLKAKPLYHQAKQYRRPEIEIIKHYGNLAKTECYPSQLNQVFVSLFTNAIDALETRYMQQVDQQIAPDPIKLWITTESLSNQNLSIRIADNGSGIDHEIQKRIFDPFFTTKPVGQGTGLGLSIAHQIITEKHQGQLTCQSDLTGTEFTIALPMRSLT